MVYNPFARWGGMRGVGAPVPRTCAALADAKGRLLSLLLRVCESLSKAWRDVTFEMFSHRRCLFEIRFRSSPVDRKNQNCAVVGRVSRNRIDSQILSGGQARDCPPSKRLIRRTRPAWKRLVDAAYDSAELRQGLQKRHQARHT